MRHLSFDTCNALKRSALLVVNAAVGQEVIQEKSAASAAVLRSALRSSFGLDGRGKSSSRVLSWVDMDHSKAASVKSVETVLPEVELETDRVPSTVPHQLREKINSELQQLRNAKITAPYYDPDWD